MDKIISHPLYKKSVEKILTAKFIDFEKFRGKKFFITGATGLLGTVLINALLHADVGVEILALTRNSYRARERFPAWENCPALRFLEQDARAEIPAGTEANFIVCGASNSHPVAYGNDPAGTALTNVFGALNAIDLAKRNPASRTIFISSCEIYGENTLGKTAFSEHDCGFTDCNTVRACYTESKRLAECLFQIAKEKSGVNFVTARLCRIFGPTMTSEDSKASQQFLRNAIAREKIVLKSAGTQLFSFGYAPDAISALLTILQKGKNGNAYNVAPEAITLRDFAKICGDCAGTKTEFAEANNTEKLGFSVVKNSILDDSAVRALGWFPQWTLREAIAETIEICSDAETRGNVKTK